MKKELIEAQRLLQVRINELNALAEKKGTEEYARAVEAVREQTGIVQEKKLLYEAERAAVESTVDDKMSDQIKKFSLAKFIREASTGNLTGVEAEMHQLAVEEARKNGIQLQGFGIPSQILRAFGGGNVTTDADGGYTVATQLQYQEALKNKLVLTQCGAQYITGLQGNIDLVTGAEIEAGWAAENAEVSTEAKKAFSKVTFKPKRNFINVPLSIQLINQSSFDIEQMIWNDIISAHAQLIDKAVIQGSGSNNQPTGILNTTGIGSVAIGTNGGAATFKSLVDLETAVSVANADVAGMCYLTNAKVRGALKTTLKATGVAGYIWENNEVNGYKAFCTNLVPSDLTKGTSASNCSAVIFGNFKDVIIGQWGGLDILVDPYTAKKSGAIELTLNAYNDVLVKRAASFAAIKDITA